MDELTKYNVSFYDEFPSGIENFEKLYEMAEERFKLYRILNMHESLSAPELETHLGNSLFRNLLQINESPETLLARKMDFISHWILRVAYCKSYPEFFIKNEVLWFQLRFNSMSYVDRKKFWLENNFEFCGPSPEEKIQYKLTRGKWIKIEFTKVINLVKLCLYPMKRGFIFIPEHKIVYCLMQRLGEDLRQSLIQINKTKLSWPEHLDNLVSTLDIVTPYRISVSHPLTFADLRNQVKHFPLCMKFQHENLVSNHHLKHFSRVQYGLFLKGLGLPLEDALNMWSIEFTKKMTEVRFQKQYSYFFKHMYGRVGSKIDYQPQSCDTIIEEPVGRGQVNGCPFKIWDNGVLGDRLKEEEFSGKNIDKIIELKSQQKYKEACSFYFQCTHYCRTELISHPTQYYERSCSVGLVDIEELFN